MSVVSTYGIGYAAGAPSEAQMLMYRKGTPTNGTAPLIIVLHGRSGDATVETPSGSQGASFGPNYFTWQLASEGYVLLSVDAGGPTAWGDTAEMSRITDAVAYASARGYKTSKIGLMGWSMGGLAALNWIKRNPTKVSCAWLWAPATDLDFFNGTAGYTPSYSTGSVAAGAFAADIAADFSPYSTSAGYRVHDEPGSFAGIAPIRIAHATDDATIPVGQSTAFVSAVNDPKVTLKTVSSGGHTGLFSNYTALEVIQHYRASL